jgi:hypothetical protein
MAKVENGLDRDPMVAMESAPARETFADRVLTFAAMAGAVGGAIGGAVLGAEVGTAFPAVCGTLGTMIGSGATAGGWCLLAHLRAGPFTKRAVHHASAPPPRGAPVTNLG